MTYTQIGLIGVAAVLALAAAVFATRAVVTARAELSYQRTLPSAAAREDRRAWLRTRGPLLSLVARIAP